MRMQFSVRGTNFLLLIVAIVVTLPASAAGPPTVISPPDFNYIVSRMEQVQIDDHDRLVPYTVTREYQLFSGDMARLTSQVVADVSFLPPDQKTYAIKQSTGSGRGEKVVKKVLEHEAEYSKNGKPVLISRRDYSFSYIGQEPLSGAQCFVLGLTPKKNDAHLLQGQVWVDASTYRVRRFEGHPAKSPSWWLKDVNLIINFGPVGQMWLQTSSQGTAEVRFFGRHRMTSRDIGHQTAMAQSAPPATHLHAVSRSTRRSSPEAAIGAAVTR